MFIFYIGTHVYIHACIQTCAFLHANMHILSNDRAFKITSGLQNAGRSLQAFKVLDASQNAGIHLSHNLVDVLELPFERTPHEPV